MLGMIFVSRSHIILPTYSQEIQMKRCVCGGGGEGAGGGLLFLYLSICLAVSVCVIQPMTKPVRMTEISARIMTT